MPPIEAPPRSMSVDDFARKAESLQASVQYSTPRPRAVKQLERAYRAIDGLTTVDLSEADAGKFVVGLTAAADVCVASLSKKRAFSLKGQDDTRTFLGELLIDKASVALQTPDFDHQELTNDMKRADNAFLATRAMRAPQTEFNARRYDHDNIGNLFGHLSTRAIRVHLDARRLEALNKRGADGILRSRIGGLALDAIGHMRLMAEELHVRPDDNLRGRFVETAAYAFKTMEWQEAPKVADRFVRFAVEREDRPATENRPRRSFDLLEGGREEYKPIQVKASARAGRGYHSRVTKLMLHHGDVVMKDVIGFTELYEQSFDANDPASARRAFAELGDYFVERQSAVPEEAAHDEALLAVS